MSIVTLLLIAAAVIFVYKGVIIVKQAEVVIIERLGKFERILESGLNFIFPIIETPRPISWKISQKGLDGKSYSFVKEKERIIEEANAKNKENEPKKKLLESRAAEIEQSEKQLKALSEIARRKEAAKTAIEQIQMAYANIRHYFKDNVPNPEEDMLSEDAVEKVMADRLRGKKSFVDQPEERSLPLLFGRAEEKKRRENLSEAINQFNKIMTEQLPKISDVYAGKILEQNSYLQMQVSAKTAQQSAEKAQKAYCDMQIGWEAENRELRQLQENEKAVSMARDRIKDKTEHNKLAAKEMVGIVEKSELQAVPETAEKKEKARLRSNNKKVVDALEQKENTLKWLNDKQKIEKYSQMQRDALMKQEHNR